MKTPVTELVRFTTCTRRAFACNFGYIVVILH